MREFHHSKYKETDGYDEIQEIDRSLHCKIHYLLWYKNKSFIPKQIIFNAAKRLNTFKKREKKKNTVFTGKFCIIPYKYVKREMTSKERGHTKFYVIPKHIEAREMLNYPIGYNLFPIDRKI